MSKYEVLNKEIEILKKEREKLKILDNQLKHEISKKENEIANYYQNFFLSKQNKDFKLYDKFPNYEALNLYLNRFERFPLNSQGIYDAKELAEVIKQLYQFERQKDYDILTIGINEKESIKDYGFTFSRIIPHLYFLIGNKDTLDFFREHDGKYYNNDNFSLYYDIRTSKGKDLVSIPLNRFGSTEDSLCISSNSESNDETRYYDYINEHYKCCSFSRNLNIFRQNLRSIPTSSKYQGIKDVLSFKAEDEFIGNILISISIYKRNNQKEELTKEDYNLIFKELYGEEVDIINNANKDIPKSLVYVPNEKEETIN